MWEKKTKGNCETLKDRGVGNEAVSLLVRSKLNGRI